MGCLQRDAAKAAVLEAKNKPAPKAKTKPATAPAVETAVAPASVPASEPAPSAAAAQSAVQQGPLDTYNGTDDDGYSWAQTAQDVTVQVSAPARQLAFHTTRR
jgi:hypothetical protein